MAIQGTDLLIAERAGASKKFQASQLIDKPNEAYLSVSGNIVLDVSFKTQIITLNGNVNVTGVSLPAVNYSTNLFLYIDSTTGDDFTIPSGWTIVGEYDATTNVNLLVLDIGSYAEGVEVVGYYLNAKTLANPTAVLNVLTSTSTTSALSANQGRILKNLIDNINECPPLLQSYDRYSVNTLPSSPTAGDLAVVNDAKDVQYRSEAVSGGTDVALVMYDRANWIYH
jgi:hypothetical protein